MSWGTPLFIMPEGALRDGLLTDNSAPGTGGIFVGQGGSAEDLYPDFLNSAGSILTESLGDAIRSWGKGVISGALNIEDVPSFIRPNVDYFISVQANYRDQPRFEDEPPTKDYTDFVPEDEPILEPIYSDEPAVENKGALDWWLRENRKGNTLKSFDELSLTKEQRDYMLAQNPSLAGGGMFTDQPGQSGNTGSNTGSNTDSNTDSNTGSSIIDSIINGNAITGSDFMGGFSNSAAINVGQILAATNHDASIGNISDTKVDNIVNNSPGLGVHAGLRATNPYMASHGDPNPTPAIADAISRGVTTPEDGVKALLQGGYDNFIAEGQTPATDSVLTSLGIDPSSFWSSTIGSQIEDPNIVDQDLTEGDLSGLDEESLFNNFQGEARGALDDILDSTGDMDEFLEAQFRWLEEQMLRGGGLGIRVNDDGSIDLTGNLGLPGPLGIFEIELRDKDGNITAGTAIKNAVEGVWKKISSVPEKVVKTAQEVIDVLTGKGNTVGGIDLSGNILDTAGQIIGSIFDSEVGPLLSGSWITPELLQGIFDLVNETVDFGSAGGKPDDNSGTGESTTGSSEGAGESTTDKSDKLELPTGGGTLDEEEDKGEKPATEQSGIIDEEDDEPRFTNTSSGSGTLDETPLTEDDDPVIPVETNNGGGVGGGGDGDGGGGGVFGGGGGGGDGGGGDGGGLGGGGDGAYGETTENQDPPLSTGGSGGGSGGGGGGGLFDSSPYMGGLGYDLQAPRSVIYDPTDPMIQLDRIIQKSLFQGMI